MLQRQLLVEMESDHLIDCFQDDLGGEGSNDEEVEGEENVVDQLRCQMVELEEMERDVRLVEEVQLLHLD